jgi:hypothetical protein
MMDMLETVNETEDTELVEDYIKLVVSTDGKDTEIQWMLTTSGIDYQAKGLTFSFDNGVLEMLTDGWFLFTVGSTELNVSPEEAIAIAIEGAEDYTWTAEGVEVTSFNILEENATAELWPHLRENQLELVPYWYVTLPLDKTYPGNIDYLDVGVWGDTGAITSYRARGLP